ncbi:DUF1360 domain-containing protein [Bacillus sp. 3255]|uniref:DUF1360 domain-containing protein n=1 Tax=Bacillus sp. 3255 TaxID=2817904 RepID=UPI0028620AE4|nr:DUF1360 domain-containing protein [Bacillus sp. 3255]MDR6884876.1 hypothetical protein [Bacillus sp. 3255]
MTILTFIILALAVFRITHFIVYDKIFEPVRNNFVTRDFIDYQFTYTLQGGSVRRFIGSVMNCYWCAGIWVSAVLIGSYLIAPTITFYVGLIFALSSIQAILETGVLKLVGMPLDMVEVKAEIEEDPLSAARGIKNALFLSLIFYLVVTFIALIVIGLLR